MYGQKETVNEEEKYEGTIDRRGLLSGAQSAHARDHSSYAGHVGRRTFFGSRMDL